MVGGIPGLPASAATTACGIDHVRLVYTYLDTGEYDGYASVLDEHVRVHGIGERCTCGREEAVLAARASAGPPGRHELYKIIAEADSVVVTGRYLASVGEFDFADVFTLSDDALVLSQRRFYCRCA